MMVAHLFDETFRTWSKVSVGYGADIILFGPQFASAKPRLLNTSLGHITSAIRKIAAASSNEECDMLLYRGLKGKLDPKFWLPDAFGIVCATDTAFMSTTCDEKTALFYMCKEEADQEAKLGLLWELQASLEDDSLVAEATAAAEEVSASAVSCGMALSRTH